MLHDNMHLGHSHTLHDIQPVATSNESNMQQTGAASAGHNAQSCDSNRSSEAAGFDHRAADQQHGGDQGQSAGSSNGSQGHNHQHPVSHDHTGHAHQHDSSVRSISISCAGEVDLIRSVPSASVMYLCIVRVECCVLALYCKVERRDAKLRLCTILFSPGPVLVAMCLGMPPGRGSISAAVCIILIGHALSCNVRADSCFVLMQTERLAGYTAVGEGHCNTGYLPDEGSY